MAMMMVVVALVLVVVVMAVVMVGVAFFRQGLVHHWLVRVRVTDGSFLIIDVGRSKYLEKQQQLCTKAEKGSLNFG